MTGGVVSIYFNLKAWSTGLVRDIWLCRTSVNTTVLVNVHVNVNVHEKLDN